VTRLKAGEAAAGSAELVENPYRDGPSICCLDKLDSYSGRTV